MPLTPSPRSLRLGVLSTAVLVAAVIAASAWSDWVATRETVSALVLGESEQMAETLGRAMQDAPVPLAEADLRTVLEENRGKGLHALLLVNRECEILASAGEFRLFQDGAPCHPLPTAWVQGRALGRKKMPHPDGRLSSDERHDPGDRPPRGKRPPPEDWPPPDEHPEPEGSPPAEVPDPPPQLVFEFETRLPEALQARAARSLMLGLTVALSLLLGGTGYWRLSRRAEAQEGRKNLERHLATLGEMSAVLAHEIRNPLASLKGNAQLLAEDLEGPQKENAQWVVTEAQRLETLTHSLLQFVRSGSVARELTDPAGILQDAVREVGPRPTIWCSPTSACHAWTEWPCSRR